MNFRNCLFPAAIFLSAITAEYASGAEYQLEIAKRPVEMNGSLYSKITVNGGIPGPTLYFREGENAVIKVTNRMDEDTSIHWHGLLLPGNMDGVPGFNGFHGIKSGTTFTYRFPIRQAGTYWYHAHSLGQEQDGLYGSIVISPAGLDPIKTDREHVVLLSDFSPENSLTILGNLKQDSGYYNYSQTTLFDFLDDVKQSGIKAAWNEALEWGFMRMSRTDLSDVSGYTFLINGKSPEQNWTGLFNPGERVRLRLINASAMTIFDLRIPGLKLTVVQADGQDVEPTVVDELRFGVAETYDVIVEPRSEAAYTIVAEPIDRTGFALGTLAVREGMRGEEPVARKRAKLNMSDMGMAHEGHMDHSMHAGHDMAGHDMAGMDDPGGWADAGTPPGNIALDYADLRSLTLRPDSKEPEREVIVRLGGSMERFIWTLNGKKFEDGEPIQLSYGERVRLKFINETMMAHPMHLHGMFVQMENGQPADKLPSKHTIIVPPAKTVSALLTADEPGEWPLHCHLLNHMLGGMMAKVIVAAPETADVAQEANYGAGVPVHHEHAPSTFHSILAEGDSGAGRDDQISSWEVDGWVGGDYNKAWFKSEGEVSEDSTESIEHWSLYSRHVAEFWDLQAGARLDSQPHSTAYAAFGVNGLAPYHFETQAHLFLSEEGDVSARLEQEYDLLLSQRLILQPYLELNLYFQDVPDQEVGAGLANSEFGLQLRYEITRKFAPYVDLRYERAFGESSGIARRNGERSEDLIAAAGLRLMF